MSNPKIICTGVKSHRARTLAKFGTGEGTFVVQRDSGGATWTAGHPKMSTQQVWFKCPVCRRDMRFASSDLYMFLSSDTGTKHKDVSVLAAILSK